MPFAKGLRLSRSAAASAREIDLAAATIAALDESSRRIRQTVTLTKQVVALPRLLVLKATIDAAGWGDARKGFAVVAHEVKELSSQPWPPVESSARWRASTQ